MRHEWRARMAGFEAVLLIVGVVGCFVTGDTVVKLLGGTVAVALIVWVRYFTQAVVMGVWRARRHGRGTLVLKNPGFHATRAVLLLTNTSASYLGLQYLPLAEFTALAMTAPIMTTAMAGLFLRQRVSALQWMLVALGFVSIVVIARPGTDVFQWAALLPLVTAASNGLLHILTARFAGREDAGTIQFWSGFFGWIGVTIGLLAWGALPRVSDVSLLQWASMVVVGLAACTGHLLMIFALARAPIATLMPYTYCQIPIAALVGWAIFARVPDQWSLVGVAGVVVVGISSMAIEWRQKRALAGGEGHKPG